MIYTRRLCLALLSLAASPVLADQVQLPYQQADGNGNQWVVYYQGALQQQGNQPVFSQAGVITVNGRQPQQNQQTASLDANARELTLTFEGRNNPAMAGAANVRHTRRLKFSEDGNTVRIIDIFDNPQDREQSLNVQLTTNTNYGVNDAQVVADTRKDPRAADAGNIGWVANTGANRAVATLLAGKGSKLKPNIRYQQGNNQCMSTYMIKVPPKQKAAIVHWYGTFDTTDAGSQWIEQIKESREVSDLPMELRKALVNIRSSGGGFIGDRELLRGSSTADIVELRGGDQMRGDIKLETYGLKTPYGTINLPAKSVAGIFNVGDYRPRQLLVTVDGEIFGGELEQATIPVQLSSGQLTQVPLPQMLRLGYRTPSNDPPEWRFDQPMVFLTGGERCRIALPTDPIELVTRYGTLKLAPDQISTILLGGSGAQEVYLSDGSHLTGVVSRSVWPLKMLTSTSAEPVQVTSAAIERLQFKAPEINVGAGSPTIGLTGTDIVSARLDGQIKLVTTFDTLTLSGPEITAISRPNPGLPDVQITMADQSTFRGTIDATTLPIQLTAGPKLDIAVAAIRDYQNPRPFPAQSVVTQANDLIAQLSAADWKQREQVEVQLIAMGPTIVGVLEDAAPKQEPDARDRLATIIKQLKKDQPPLTSRLPLPAAIE